MPTWIILEEWASQNSLISEMQRTITLNFVGCVWMWIISTQKTCPHARKCKTNYWEIQPNPSWQVVWSTGGIITKVLITGI